jgi:hypothetical protein
MLIDDIDVSPEGLAQLNREAVRVERVAKKIGFPGPLTWETLKRREQPRQEGAGGLVRGHDSGPRLKRRQNRFWRGS